MYQRREKGMGTIYEYPKNSGRKKRFRATVVIDGTTVRQYFQTEAEAKAFLKDTNKKNKAVTRTESGDITFLAFTPVFLEKKKKELKIGSYETLEGNINIINSFIGNLPLIDCDNDTLQQLIYDLQEKEYSRSVLSKVKFNTIAILRLAASKGILEKMPVFNIIIPESKLQEENENFDPEHNCLTEEEMALYEAEAVRTKVSTNKYTKYCGVEVMAHQNGWKLCLLLHTGMRIGELVALNWSDWSEPSKTIRINKNVRRVKQGKITQIPKSNAGNRVIVLNKSAYEDIKQLKKQFDEQTKDLERREKEALGEAKTEAQKRAIREEYAEYKAEHKYIAGSATFPYGMGDASSLRKTHNKICDAIKLPHPFTPHGLRHSYCTYTYLHRIRNKKDPNDNFDLPELSRVLGHSSVRVTLEIYSHLSMVDNQSVKRTADDLKDF